MALPSGFRPLATAYCCLPTANCLLLFRERGHAGQSQPGEKLERRAAAG